MCAVHVDSKTTVGGGGGSVYNNAPKFRDSFVCKAKFVPSCVKITRLVVLIIALVLEAVPNLTK